MSASGLALLSKENKCWARHIPNHPRGKKGAKKVRSKETVAQEATSFGHVRSTYLNLLLRNIGRLDGSAKEYITSKCMDLPGC